jgi:hypothetical protein
MKHITRSITSLMRTALSIKSIAAILSLMALSGAHLEAFASGGDGSSTLVSTSHIQPEPQAMKSFLTGTWAFCGQATIAGCS